MDILKIRAILNPCNTKVKGVSMANLTITVDKETLKKARMNALAQNTSVNRILQESLEAYAGDNRERKNALRHIISMSTASRSRRGKWQWNRDEVHQRK